MKTLLGVISLLNLFGGIVCLIMAPPLAAACFGAALVSGVGYAILDRLDSIAAGAEQLNAIRNLLTEIRDRNRPNNPAVDDPTRLAEAQNTLESIRAGRGVLPNR